MDTTRYKKIRRFFQRESLSAFCPANKIREKKKRRIHFTIRFRNRKKEFFFGRMLHVSDFVFFLSTGRPITKSRTIEWSQRLASCAIFSWKKKYWPAAASARMYIFFFLSRGFCHHYMQIKPAENLTSARFPLFHLLFLGRLDFSAFRLLLSPKQKEEGITSFSTAPPLYRVGILCFDSAVTHIALQTSSSLSWWLWNDVTSSHREREREWSARSGYTTLLRAVLAPAAA